MNFEKKKMDSPENKFSLAEAVSFRKPWKVREIISTKRTWEKTAALATQPRKAARSEPLRCQRAASARARPAPPPSALFPTTARTHTAQGRARTQGKISSGSERLTPLPIGSFHQYNNCFPLFPFHFLSRKCCYCNMPKI